MTQETKPTEEYKIIINLQDMHEGQAKLYKMEEYLSKSQELAGYGNEVTLTGAAPVWMYLKIALSLQGKALRVYYEAPNCGSILIFDHYPF